MRIISGKYKNKTLKSPQSDSTHPMGERERLAIFNMIGDLSGKNVLDLFAGTGALGIEALSRGASSCTFVENNPKTIACLKANLANIDADVRIVKQDAYKFQPEAKFDIVFIDPPYDTFDSKVLEFKKHLSSGGIMVVSSPKNEEFECANSRTYAACRISIIMI
jgi:16S rRNA (guanine966-N2)-methyltransferase